MRLDINTRDALPRLLTQGTLRTTTSPFVRAVPTAEPAERDGDGNTLDGYASVFNSETVILSWDGRFKERFLPGSMKKSFRQSTPIIQFDHGSHPLIGSLPIARFEPGYPREETDPTHAPDGGAHVVAQLHESPLFAPVREVISTGTVNGMSIRFTVAREAWYWPDGRQVESPAEVEAELYRTWREDVPDRELLRRDILEAGVSEMGPVVWPAYSSTSVGVRTASEDLDPTDPLAASDAESADGEDSDAERQEPEASPNPHALKRARALRLLGVHDG